jgi:trigger factor
VTVDHLAPCKKLLRVEIDVAAVEAEFENITRQFQKQAQLPGFRPGKAPREQIVKNFGPRISDEVKEKLVSENLRSAMEKEKIRPAARPNVEEVQFERGKPLQFAVALETEPEFELPEYKGMTLTREKHPVTDEDVTRAIDALRDHAAKYNDITRPLQIGDIAVVNYTGTCEGKPVSDLVPTARGLTEQKNFWVKIEQNSFIPGFTEQLIGANPGEKRTVNVTFPADFVVPQIAGKAAVYEVELVSIKEKLLPEVNDEFAKSYGAESIEKLRAGVRVDLENERKMQEGRALRAQIIRSLNEKVSCELPETVVTAETRSIVYDLVRENQQRGVAKETIEAQKDEIFNAANVSAKDRVKTTFILMRIAEKEQLQVAQEEILRRAMQLAEQSQMTLEKFWKELQQRDGVADLHHQLLTGKVFDFILLNAKIDETVASPAAPPQVS